MVGMEAAFFDLDKTVIDRASIAAFGRPFMKGGLINRRVVARAALSQLIYLYFGADEERLVRVRESMLAMTKGWDRDQVRQIVRETLLETIEPIMYAEALELMELHRAAGHRVYLVSASPEEIVLPLTDMLGVDGAICSRGEVDDEGRYTGRMAFYAYGPEKATAMRELAARTGIDLSGEQRLLGLGHRSAHARGRGPAGGGERRPRPGQGGPGAGVGDAPVHQADPPA
jgi:HAD superfamily hydrolase (TIGR01490 family)